MDQDLKNKLIVIVSITISIVALYFLISPYQNCVRSYPGKYVNNKGQSFNSQYGTTEPKEQFCRNRTSW